MSRSLTENLRSLDLPEDVGRIIFELIAELDKETGRSCALVSKRVNAWVEPILYRTLLIDHKALLENLCGIFEDINHGKSAKSSDFFASHVKALIITSDYLQDATNILSILKACHNVELLTLWTNPREGDSVRPHGRDLRDLRDFMASSGLSPRWISVTSRIFSIYDHEVDFSYPIFQNATHLELVWEEGDSGPDQVCWDTLRHLPCLTHFSVYWSFYSIEECSRWAREAVGLCPLSLRVFVLWVPSACYDFNETSEEYGALMAIQDGTVDSRAVLAYVGESSLTLYDLHPILRSYRDVLGDWAGVPVGKDFWTLAEELIEERHRRRETQNTLKHFMNDVTDPERSCTQVELDLAMEWYLGARDSIDEYV
ncbi:hypothetical protein H1R20_g15386, partial [Candolleomyces eurysporus]